MRLVDLKCPNCSGNLVKEGDNFVCRSCGGSFAVDYDSSDIEHERIKAVASMDPEEKREQSEKAAKAAARKKKKESEGKITKITISDDADILNPKLYKAIQAWRREKAAMMKVPSSWTSQGSVFSS